MEDHMDRPVVPRKGKTGNPRSVGSEFPVSEAGEGDGVDPRLENRKREFQKSDGKPDYTAERLGKRIGRVLGIETALPSIEGLESFNISEASFNGRGNCYELIVYCVDQGLSYDPMEIREILKRRKGWLRSMLAESVRRKMVPDLVFTVLPPGVRP
jgi:hypothetical protein